MPNLDLTTLSRMKAYMGNYDVPSNPNTDQLLTMFIHSTSSIIMGYLERGSFISMPHSDIFDGQGTQQRFPHYWPVSSVSNVQVDNFVVPPAAIISPATATSNTNLCGGWRMEQWDGIPPGEHQSVELDGYAFRRGKLNCRIDYIAGYLATETVNTGLFAGPPAVDESVVLSQNMGLWLADNGVKYTLSGVPLTLVKGPPVSGGTYSIDPTTPGGYLFAPPDANVNVDISYSFCPYAVEQACWEFVAVSYNRRQHPGQRSRSLAAQESVTYDPQGIPAYIVDALQPFRSIIPE